ICFGVLHLVFANEKSVDSLLKREVTASGWESGAAHLNAFSKVHFILLGRKHGEHSMRVLDVLEEVRHTVKSTRLPHH
ncbi:hypothetical protein VIGAN_UM010900, partial [Vigna angularis var. angularis]